MITITSPDAMGTLRILVDGVEMFSVVEMRMGAHAQKFYGQAVEYGVFSPTTCFRYYTLDQSKAVEIAVGRAVQD